VLKGRLDAVDDTGTEYASRPPTLLSLLDILSRSSSSALWIKDPPGGPARRIVIGPELRAVR
jgi:hypothetical protein